ncbi:MAG: DUF2066 domain-containing protein [Xanthomonadaceae bacterium]|nr:DUF2066 domain-containing protein [Xanthomonadaceae bacterium]
MSIVMTFGVGVAHAQRVEGERAAAGGIYEAEVPVNGQGEAERNAAFGRGLAQVLAKLSGDRGATGRPGVGQELRRAKDYVTGFDYRQDQGVSANGTPNFKTMLVVRYDRAKVEGMIGMLGLPMWPQPRPKPVLWLAIDDGKGPRLVGVGQSNAARSVLDRAIERGYRLGLPTGNAAEQAAVGAIWRGDTGAIARLSSRYSPPMQLIGKLYRKGATGWQADWTFVDSGRVLSTWKTSDADARRAMAAGADGGADALIRKYARRGSGAGAPGTFRVTIAGIDSADDYIRLSAHLQELSVVRRIRPVSASGNTLVVELELLTGMSGFKRMAESRGVLIPSEGAETPTFDLR